MKGNTPDLSEIQNTRDRLRIEEAYEMMRECSVCPRNCGINRLAGETGTCRTGVLARVSATNLHFGEEPPISGCQGSGTVFFSYCNLACDFCQNFPISQYGYGREMTAMELSGTFLSLESRGAHNINLVTPSHVIPQIAHALVLSRERGLTLPVVYNSNGYDQPEMLSFLDGLVDIYLPDMKYSDDRAALRYSKAPDYVRINRAAVSVMAGQVGPLVLDENRVAKKGLMIRHLLLPGGISGFPETARYIREVLGTQIHVSFMAQYFPAHRASRISPLSRKITSQEYEAGLEALFAEQLFEGYIQELEMDEECLSDLNEQEN